MNINALTIAALALSASCDSTAQLFRVFGRQAFELEPNRPRPGHGSNRFSRKAWNKRKRNRK